MNSHSTLIVIYSLCYTTTWNGIYAKSLSEQFNSVKAYDC